MSNNRPGGDIRDGSGRLDPVGEQWRKSSFSMSDSCVEVGLLAGRHIGVRDSKASAGSYLRFPPRAWTEFLGNIEGLSR